MKVARLFVPLAVLILGCAFTSAARTTPTNPKTTNKTTKAAVHHMTGTVTSVSGSDLVLAHEWKGKKEETKFVLDSTTKKEGDITKGAHATISYEMQNKERKATNVKVVAMKSPKSAKTKKSS